ncbi:hypothetical protein VP01_2725g2 [Puccinia sorghi]|uniref:Uncharacterized protein n=1 Tax=Puccinia sorghi TaxID=27349 RepID=A0A0L6V3D0_9BASI|nr:hypothetical protein VP01_2725g2 [Puccinia sorghi]
MKALACKCHGNSPACEMTNFTMLKTVNLYLHSQTLRKNQGQLTLRSHPSPLSSNSSLTNLTKQMTSNLKNFQSHLLTQLRPHLWNQYYSSFSISPHSHISLLFSPLSSINCSGYSLSFSYCPIQLFFSVFMSKLYLGIILPLFHSLLSYSSLLQLDFPCLIWSTWLSSTDNLIYLLGPFVNFQSKIHKYKLGLVYSSLYGIYTVAFDLDSFYLILLKSVTCSQNVQSLLFTIQNSPQASENKNHILPKTEQDLFSSLPINTLIENKILIFFPLTNSDIKSTTSTGLRISIDHTFLTKLIGSLFILFISKKFHSSFFYFYTLFSFEIFNHNFSNFNLVLGWRCLNPTNLKCLDQPRGANNLGSTNLFFIDSKDQQDYLCSIEVKRLRRLINRLTSRIKNVVLFFRPNSDSLSLQSYQAELSKKCSSVASRQSNHAIKINFPL